MKRKKELSPRDQRMLELLALGLPNKAIARRMGYKHGTTRVYLHQLYRKLGVAGKTAAVVWYVDRHRAATPAKPAARSAVSPGVPALAETVGDLALRSDLFTALGAMSLLVGPHGRLWEVAARLRGETVDSASDARARRSRILWEALLRGDFAHGKRLHDDEQESQRLLDSPVDAVQLALLLWLGGHWAAAARVTSDIARAKQGAPRATTRDTQLLEAVRDSTERRKADGLERIYRSAVAAAAHTPGRHVAMAALFHAYALHGDTERARRTAEALWAEAEASRQHLTAMGERVLPQDASLPRPVTALATTTAAAARLKEQSGVR